MKKIAFLLVALAVVAGLAYYFTSLPTSPEIVEKESEKKTTENGVDIKLGLKGCDICGYNALEEKGGICGNCGLEINSKAVDAEDLTSVDEYLIIKQIEHFMPDTLGSSVDFLNPAISAKGYPKNSNWRPRVYETQIFEIQRAMLEADERKSANADSSVTSAPAL